MDNTQQSAMDRATIRVKLIENGVMVGCGELGWFAFKTWEDASEHIAARLEKLKKLRQEAPR